MNSFGIRHFRLLCLNNLFLCLRSSLFHISPCSSPIQTLIVYVLLIKQVTGQKRHFRFVLSLLLIVDAGNSLLRVQNPEWVNWKVNLSWLLMFCQNFSPEWEAFCKLCSDRQNVILTHTHAHSNLVLTKTNWNKKITYWTIYLKSLRWVWFQGFFVMQINPGIADGFTNW